MNTGTFDVRDYGARGDATTDDTAAFQACIDDALGGGDPATMGRNARGPVIVPPGEYLISEPLRVHSAQYFVMRGEGGSSRLTPIGPAMASVLDLNGVAYSTFADFLIGGRDGDGHGVTNAIDLYWDPATAYRSSTRNVLRGIMVQGVRCVVAIRVGRTGSGLQCDQVAYHDLGLEGRWTPGEATYHQRGLHIGDNVYGNNLIHSAYNLTCSGWAEGVLVEASNFAMFGGGFGGNGIDLSAQCLSYFSAEGFRSESSGRLFVSVPQSGNPAIYRLGDVIWSCDRMAGDGEFVRMRTAGTLTMTNLHVCNGGADAHLGYGTALPQTIRLAGILCDNELEDFLGDPWERTAAIVEGYYCTAPDALDRSTEGEFLGP